MAYSIVINSTLERRIRDAAAEGRRLSKLEEENGLRPNDELTDAWEALDDERAEIVYALAVQIGAA